MIVWRCHAQRGTISRALGRGFVRQPDPNSPCRDENSGSAPPGQTGGDQFSPVLRTYDAMGESTKVTLARRLKEVEVKGR